MDFEINNVNNGIMLVPVRESETIINIPRSTNNKYMNQVIDLILTLLNNFDNNIYNLLQGSVIQMLICKRQNAVRWTLIYLDEFMDPIGRLQLNDLKEILRNRYVYLQINSENDPLFRNLPQSLLTTYYNNNHHLRDLISNSEEDIN